MSLIETDESMTQGSSTQEPSRKRSLPIALLSAALVSPFLISAARPPVLDSISATCRLEETTAREFERREGAAVSTLGELETETQVETEDKLTSFVRDRWNAVRRLIRENPYFTESTPEQQAQAEAFCLARIRADYEQLLAQAPSSEPVKIEALPDLSGSPARSSSPSIEPDTRSQSENQAVPDAVIMQPSEARPALSQPIQPESSPDRAPLAEPSVAPLVLPTAQDPSTYSGPAFEPTPFDGTVVRTLADMPDGNYRFIAGEAEERAYSNEELLQRGGSVFVLRKVGDKVTGDLLPRIGLPGICVTGTVSGDIITGAAYPYDTTDSLQDSARQIGENYEPHGSGALKIRRTRTEGDRLYYAGALLNLSTFTPINAGLSLPPSSCQVGPTGGRDQ